LDALVARDRRRLGDSVGGTSDRALGGLRWPHLYGGMDEPEIKIIDVFMCKLRRKLAAASNGKDYIETVWGRGYVLRPPLEDEEKIPA
jgi:Transcriptional regulatory protein, C terminal